MRARCGARLQEETGRLRESLRLARKDAERADRFEKDLTKSEVGESFFITAAVYLKPQRSWLLLLQVFCPCLIDDLASIDMCSFSSVPR